MCQNFLCLEIIKWFFCIFFWNQRWILYNLVFNGLILKEWVRKGLTFFFPSVDDKLFSLGHQKKSFFLYQLQLQLHYKLFPHMYESLSRLCALLHWPICLPLYSDHLSYYVIHSTPLADKEGVSIFGIRILLATLNSCVSSAYSLASSFWIL